MMPTDWTVSYGKKIEKKRQTYFFYKLSALIGGV